MSSFDLDALDPKDESKMETQTFYEDIDRFLAEYDGDLFDIDLLTSDTENTYKKKDDFQTRAI